MKLAGHEFVPQPYSEDPAEFIAIGLAEGMLDALEKFGRHTPVCPKWKHRNQFNETHDCNCGYETALSGN
jgi:hypothetical protein